MSTLVGLHDAKTAEWICTAITFFILLARIGFEVHRFKGAIASTYVAIFSVAVVAARIAVSNTVLEYGSVGSYRAKYGTSTDHPVQLRKAKVGSQYTLAARALDSTVYWLQCCLLLLMYRSLLNHMPWVNLTIKTTWLVIATTYPAVIIITFVECRPIYVYWKLVNPPPCQRAYGQLLTQAITNIVIDLFLLVIAWPIFRAQIRSFPKNLQLGFMYICGFFCTITTCVRLWNVYQEHSDQYGRSFWASIQAVVAAFVANVPAIYGAARLFRRERQGSVATTAPQSTALTPQTSPLAFMESLSKKRSRSELDYTQTSATQTSASRDFGV